MTLPKDPGASWKSDYSLHLAVGAVLSVGLVLAAAHLPLYKSTPDTPTPPPPEVVDVQELTPPTPDAKPAPPPSPTPPEVVPDDHIIAEPTFEPPDEIDLEPGSETTVPPPPEPASEKERDEPFVVVEQMPEPKGGLSALYENLEYPRAARQAGVEGRVVLQFIVRPDGSVEDVTVLKGVNRWLDKAAIEAVKETEFTPGRQRDRAVPVRMTLPVTFRLN